MKLIRKINLSTLVILIGIAANSVQMRCMQRASIARHAETLREVEENRKMIDVKAADRFTKTDAIRAGVIVPAKQP